MTNPNKGAMPEPLRLAAWLNEGAWHQMRLGDVEAAGRELRRLHAENEALHAKVAAQPAATPSGVAERTGCTAGTDEECTRRGCATSCPTLRASHGQAPAQPADKPLLSPTEQKWVLQSPIAIAQLLSFIDIDYSHGVSVLGPEECEPWPPKRYTELKEIGRKIIAQDPECFNAEYLREFGFPTPSPQAAQQAPAGATHDWLPFSKRTQIADRHGVKVTAEFNSLVRDVIQTYLQTHTPAAPTPAQQAGATFQQRVHPWLLECFGAAIAADRVERNHRFLEEALELVQSLGCTASEAHQLVDYVFGRPVGEPMQEAGGVMVTLAALCLASGLDMHQAGETELARISVPEIVSKIRAKQAAKPKHSPLPMEAQQAPAGATEMFSEYGCVTTHSVTGQQFFYAKGESPYLDNASECVTVYAKEKHPRQSDQDHAQMAGHDAGGIGAAGGLGANQHHEHRIGEPDPQREESERDSERAWVHSPCDVSQEVVTIERLLSVARNWGEVEPYLCRSGSGEQRYRIVFGVHERAAHFAKELLTTPAQQAVEGGDAVLEAAAQLLESQHTWITNVAAANLVRSLAARAAQKEGE